MTIEIKYIPTIKKFGANQLKDRQAIKEITAELFPAKHPNHFWGYQSSFVSPEYMDEFCNKAFERGWSIITINPESIVQ